MSMFQDVVLGSVGFKSRCTKKTASVTTSTDAIATSESSTEPLFGFVDGATQTEPKATATTSFKAKDAKGEADTEEETMRTLEFIRRVGPMMLREMSTNATTSSYFGGIASLILSYQPCICEWLDLSELALWLAAYDRI